MVGAFSLDQNGGVTGAEDFNDNLIVENEPLTGGAATLGTGRALEPSPSPRTVSRSSLTTTRLTPLTSSSLRRTMLSSLPATPIRKLALRPSPPPPWRSQCWWRQRPVAAAGFVTISGASVSGTGDINANGTVVTGTSFTGTAGAAGPGGRVAVALSDFNPATNLVLYPSSGGTLMLETDTANLTIGSAQVQTAGAAIAASEGYGLNLPRSIPAKAKGNFLKRRHRPVHHDQQRFQRSRRHQR